jgi:hypothetical protein
MADMADLISAETDIDMFIASTKSGNPFPHENFTVEQYKASANV